MKIKLIVASLSVLGLVSCPVLAATKHHKVHHHTKACHHEHHDYKAMGDLPPVVPAPVVTVTPRVDPRQLTLEEMTQNIGRANVAAPDWFNRIGITGGLNVDGHWGNLDNGYAGENARRVSVNDAYLNVTGYVNDWTKAFIALSYNNAAFGGVLGGVGGNGPNVVVANLPGNYSNAYSSNNLNAEQAYITFGNFDYTPIFVQVGKQFQDFGRYQIHPLTRTITQVLSESLQTSGKIAFLTEMGFNGSIYGFDNTIRQTNAAFTNTAIHTTPIYGASLGYDHPDTQLGYDIGVGYMSNMSGVNDVAYAITTFNGPFFIDRVAALNIYGDVNSGPFTLGARYTTALSRFNIIDLSNFFSPIGPVLSPLVTTGAKPWGFDITAGYNFNAWCYNQNIYLGYQASGDAVNIFLPKNRWMLGYGVDVFKNTTISGEWDYDRAYSAPNGGTGQRTNLFGVRAAVKFG